MSGALINKVSADPTEAIEDISLVHSFTTALTPPLAFNPEGGDHTVRAKLYDVTGFCSDDHSTCTYDSDCTSPAFCNYRGYKVFFKVLSGPNAGATGSDLTNRNGVARFTYTDSNGPGKDSISACADENDDVTYDSSYDDCAGENEN